MDLYEQKAHDLELAQTNRHRKSKNRNAFFDDPVEDAIFKEIKDLRALSETFDPKNPR